MHSERSYTEFGINAPIKRGIHLYFPLQFAFIVQHYPVAHMISNYPEMGPAGFENLRSVMRAHHK
jgi:hypothetical protein